MIRWSTPVSRKRFTYQNEYVGTAVDATISLCSISASKKCKVKVHPITDHEGQEGEKRYSSTLALTSALVGVGGQYHAPADLPPGKTRYPLYRRLGGPQGRPGRVRKIPPPPEFDPRTVQPVASRYTDWAIPAHIFFFNFFKTIYCKESMYNMYKIQKLFP